MVKGKKRATASFHEHDHGDTTENSVIQISGDYRRRRIRRHPVHLEQPATPHLDATAGQDFPSFDPSEFRDSLPESITDQVEGITVVTKEKAKRYENSVSLQYYFTMIHGLMIIPTGCSSKDVCTISVQLPR